MKMKSFGLTETKLFHFHRIFKEGGGEGGGGVQANPIRIRHCNPCGSLVSNSVSVNMNMFFV